MTYDLGETVDLAALLPGATAVTLTVTKPDGTTATPTATASGSRWSAVYTPGTPGLHAFRFLSTSGSAGAYVDTFTVADPAAFPVVSLSAVKDHLNITSTDSDEELRHMIGVASERGESWTGRVFGRRAIVDTLSGGVSYLPLNHCPVLSVTSITENGVTVPASGWRLSSREGAVIERVAGYSTSLWAPGSGNIVVTYVAGYSVQPSTDAQGTLEMVRHLWSTQRGSIRARANGDPGMLATFSVPLRVQELWESHLMGGSI